MPDDKNIFWIGANILFDLRTGATNQVLLFVFREEDASTFTNADADSFLAFVQGRAAQFGGKITWSIDEASRRRGYYVIRGEQSV